MLRKILPLFFAISWGLEQNLHAALFLAPGADLVGFQKQALQTNQQTYTQWFRESVSLNGIEAHAQVLEFSQRALQTGSDKQILTEWELLRQSLDLNAADREVLFLLAEKLKITKELCRLALLDKNLIALLENPEIFRACPQKTQALSPSFLKQIRPEDLVVIDGKVFGKEQIPEKLTPGSYQWRLISNSHEDFRFQASLSELSTQQIPRQPWVSGTCEDYKLNHKDFSVLAQAQIYFDQNCIVPGLRPEKTLQTWAQEHKTLMWGLAFIAAGFAAYQLKDKTLVMTKP